jgi:UDP-N-acetylmuramoyl-L-alanyl-D-glutamate--2,6-diaminopimelate ligase
MTAPMKLSDLLSDSAVLDARLGAIEATGITADSRAVTRGDVFVAVPGTKADGLAFATHALARGAVAVVADRAAPSLPAGAPFSRSRTRDARSRAERQESIRGSPRRSPP